MLVAAGTPVGQQPERGREVPAVAGQRVLHPRRPGRIRASRRRSPRARGGAGARSGCLARGRAALPVAPRSAGRRRAGHRRAAGSSGRRRAPGQPRAGSWSRVAGAGRVSVTESMVGECGACTAVASVVCCKSQLTTHYEHCPAVARSLQTCQHSTSFPQSLTSIAGSVAPSIVGIGSRLRGSGVVIADGQVLTNAHNVRGDEVTVTFADGRSTTGPAGRDRRGRRPRGHRGRHRRAPRPLPGPTVTAPRPAPSSLPAPRRRVVARA